MAVKARPCVSWKMTVVLLYTLYIINLTILKGIGPRKRENLPGKNTLRIKN
jgi:hypothetical protein